MKSSLMIVLFFGGLLQLVAGEAFMSVKFLTFRNPRGRGSNRHCCDGRFFFCVSMCDHQFTLCLDQIDGPDKDANHCTYGKTSSGEIANKNYINFKTKIGRLPNPYIWRLSSWPGQVRLKINIVDVDDHNDNDHVDFLNKVIAVEPSKSLVGYRYKLRNNVELTFETRVYCGKDFYGLNCSVYCKSRDDDRGHYTCHGQSGTKICMPGWIGDNCDESEDNCKSVKCHNGGQCLDLVNDFMCQCSKGFLGRFCDQDMDECLDQSLCLHGDCINSHGSFTCNCHEGYTGNTCDTNIDDCKSQPCQNGGICNDLIGDFACKCIVGFTGPVCETDVDECDFLPCANNATCINTIGAYKCDCLPGYRGNDCSLDVNECIRRPCLNGGSCNNYSGAYDCECLQGFEGPKCESDIDECQGSESVCQNNGTCRNMYGSYECICSKGYQGHLCQEDVDECEQHPCEHEGHCHNQPGNFSCECQNGYTGELCESNIDECESNVCQHGGNCTDLDGSFRCACTPFWEGPTCSDNIDECLSYPCGNNGQCLNAEEGFNCICRRGYLGILCQEDLNECEMDEYCLNNSTCTNTFGDYKCDCQEGWRGQNCEEDINECDTFGCSNLGTCVNLKGSFLCQCPINWSGKMCEIDVDECQAEENPCQNNGTCKNMVGTFHCRCAQGWTGVLCDADINECEENLQLCSVGGNSSIDKYNSTDTDQHMMCVNTQPGYACLCAPGWTGEFCDVDIDECSVGTTNSNLNDPYQSTFGGDKEEDWSANTTYTIDKHNSSAPNSTNGNESITKDMEIVDYNRTYSPIGMSTDSKRMHSYILSPACLNNGMCFNTPGSFHCACSSNWVGRRCQINRTDCQSKNKCGRFGRCVLGDTVSCQCQEGWTGPKCDKISPCQESPCKNGGICHLEQNSSLPACKCSKEWTGKFCDECRYGACLNGGDCVLDSDNEKRCRCIQGWTGVSCETAISDEDLSRDLSGNYKTRSQNPSSISLDTTHATTKNIFSTRYDANTTANASHPFCSEPVEPCGNFSCFNQGHCAIERNGTTRCVCQQGWRGKDCLKDVDECLATPCKNKGICINTKGFFFCKCQGMWDGDDCSGIELNIPFYLACQINDSNAWAINKGLKQMFMDSQIFGGQQLSIDHKREIGKSKKGDIITSIYPVVHVDNRRLTDQEVVYVIRQFAFKFRDYIFCPLFLDSVAGRLSFQSQPLNSETANWYPGLITACVLLLVVALVLAVVKCRRGKVCCASNYSLETENEGSRSFRNEVYTDSIYTIAQSDDHFPSDIHQPNNRIGDTSSLVDPNTREMRAPLHITNPLYSTLDEGDLEEEMRKATEDRTSSITSEEDSPDGQPSEVKSAPDVPSPANNDSDPVVHDFNNDSTNNVDAQNSHYEGMEGATSSRYENLEGHRCERLNSNTKYSTVMSPDSEMPETEGNDQPKGSEETYLKMLARSNVDWTNAEEDHYSSLDEEKVKRRERRPARRQRALDEEQDKYKNLPYIDDPTYATVGSRGGNSSP